MSVLSALALIIAVFIYIVIAQWFILKYTKNKKAEVVLTQESANFKVFYFEQKILQFLNAEANTAKSFIIGARIVIVAALVVTFSVFRGLSLTMIGAIIATMVADDAYKKVIYQSGITNIVNINNFINYFVPHINSGNSADQSLLGYIAYSKDQSLFDFYENKDNSAFKASKHSQQIIDIYQIAKYNEDKGINDYAYILNDIAKDYSQKQTYYNKFMASMGEIKPTEFSYYIGVPLLISISYSQTSEFWRGFGGAILSIALLVLFCIFKFLIFKLQKKTIESIF